MSYHFLADALVVFHFAFVTFVMVGGTLVLLRTWVMVLHLPAVAWGMYIELSHGICPLTPIENHWRELGGGTAYQGAFVDHYIMPVLYPRGLTDQMQVAIAVIILTINVVCYSLVVYRWRRRRKVEPAPVEVTP